MPAMMNTDQAFATFMRTFEASGLRPALAFLLSLTDYRFIAIFRFQDDRATAAVIYDRELPDDLTTEEVPASATYCCYARDARGVFTTVDALQDARLATHVAREAVRSYCGIPVMTPEGEILGTLCHYDIVPRDPARIDLPLLLRVASALAQANAVPAYPAQPA